MRTILFVCTGNTCRSPLAEAITQHWVDQGGLGTGDRVLAVSAGVAASGGQPAAEEALNTLAGLGIAHDGRSKLLTAEMVRQAAVVFGMTAAHVRAAEALRGKASGHDVAILPLDPDGDIEDPIGHGQDVYDRLGRRLMQLIPKRLQEVFSHEDRAGVGSSRRRGRA